MGTLNCRRRLRLITLLCLLLWTGTLHAATSSGSVSWIYDGDTIKVDGIGKVRLIGIDTPERESSSRDSYYRERYQIPEPQLRKIALEALAFNINQVKGKRVYLEFDRVKHDKFGRTLAYVYLPDGTLLNRLLIAQGLASAYRRFDFRLKSEFFETEEIARNAAIGLWQH